MSTHPAAARARALPQGTLLPCAALTVITVPMALFGHDLVLTAWLRAVFFTVLWLSFRTIRRRHANPRDLGHRLVVSGFLLLAAGFGLSAVVQSLPSAPRQGAAFLTEWDDGPFLLLGTALIAFGLLLLIGQLIATQQHLRQRYRRTRTALHHSERTRARAEQRLRDAETLRAVGEMAAGLAHDLRNPMAVVKAAAEDLGGRLADAPQLRTHVDVIGRNVARLERSVQALLDVARRPQPELQAVDVAQLLRECVDVTRGDGAVAVDVGDCAIAAELDIDLATRAVTNLLSNAVQASPPGSAVRLRARRCPGAEAQLLVLSIADRGRGLPSELRSGAVRPFFTTRRGGIGLGLLSARRAVEALGGELRLHARPGGGTRALLALPLRPVPAAVAEAVP